MWQIMEELARQREREIAARTRSLLLTHHPAGEPTRPNRSERGRATLPALSLDKWRRWSAKPDQVHCSRAAALGGC
jgi:hypothetical protein